ncbi:pyridoxal phosphate-dependent aminotransferase [Metabacillus idriensis]|uniref:pyridoxal phosphate-dependent aminotransferase n=1 Tax=Metabacillus idriensis TaxID=324768 RepID=UPI00174D937A|nr:aminotransferase class I/II-fold pyridoxal phosphate-dependent enzyme [Metabacillus idriensis]
MWPQHGGKSASIQAVLQKKGITKKEFLDFSANLNPLGTPGEMIKVMHKSIDLLSSVYPDPEYPEEREILAEFEGVKEKNLLLTNGGAEAIFLVSKMFQNGKAGILQPTFSEYERACLSHDVKVFNLRFEDIKNVKKEQCDVLFLCRPNNPTGEMIEKKSIQKLLKYTLLNGIYVVIDEAFIHFIDKQDESLKDLLEHYSNLIIIRSLTKIYAVPGIRSGYILANETIIKKLRALTTPWSVNCVALSMIHALPHTYDHLEETKQWLKEEWRWLKTELLALNFNPSETKVNFYLLNDPKLENHEPLLLFLANEGILARHTNNFPLIEGSSVRLAIRSREENRLLLTALKKWRNHL